MTQNEGSQRERSIEGAKLLYDASCSVCKQLAYRFQRATENDVEILSLSSPEGEQVLDAHYPDGWSENFYFVDEDGCREGIRALPAIAKMAGFRDSSRLAREYVSLKRRSNECDGCDHSHAETERGVSRRAFAGLVSAAAVPLSPFTDSAAAEQAGRGLQRPPSLQVHVATVRSDGEGGFETTLERRQDLILDEDPETTAPQDTSDDQVNTLYPKEDATLMEGSSSSGASFRIQRQTNEVEYENPEPKFRQAMSVQGGHEDRAEITYYGGGVDHDRFSIDIQAGRGPVVSASGEPTEMTTLTGTVEHDTAQPVIDYVWVDTDDLHSADHVAAYAAGVGALGDFHADHGNTELVRLYGSIENELRELHSNFDGAVDDDQLAPASNHIAISGLPGFQQFARPPENALPSVQSGLECKWGCAFDILCCGLGPGCGICAGGGLGCSLGGCCVVGYSCGYYCCYNW